MTLVLDPITGRLTNIPEGQPPPPGTLPLAPPVDASLAGAFPNVPGAPPGFDIGQAQPSSPPTAQAQGPVGTTAAPPQQSRFASRHPRLSGFLRGLPASLAALEPGPTVAPTPSGLEGGFTGALRALSGAGKTFLAAREGRNQARVTGNLRVAAERASQKLAAGEDLTAQDIFALESVTGTPLRSASGEAARRAQENVQAGRVASADAELRAQVAREGIVRSAESDELRAAVDRETIASRERVAGGVTAVSQQEADTRARLVQGQLTKVASDILGALTFPEEGVTVEIAGEQKHFTRAQTVEAANKAVIAMIEGKEPKPDDAKVFHSLTPITTEQVKIAQIRMGVRMTEFGNAMTQLIITKFGSVQAFAQQNPEAFAAYTDILSPGFASRLRDSEPGSRASFAALREIFPTEASKWTRLTDFLGKTKAKLFDSDTGLFAEEETPVQSGGREIAEEVRSILQAEPAAGSRSPAAKARLRQLRDEAAALGLSVQDINDILSPPE